DEECRRANLPRPSEGLSRENLTQRHAVVFLTNQSMLGQSKAQMQPKKLTALVEWLGAHPEEDVQLVPVSVFWGRAPSRENSIFKLLVSDSWGVPGMFHKLFIIFAQGRSTLVHFNEPLAMRQVLNEGLSQERTTRKIARVLRT